MSSENPSQHHANKAHRVLAGERLKYTVIIHKPDGSCIEFQSAAPVKLDYNNEARALWFCAGDYGSHPIMAYEPGMIILQEENPK